MAKKGQQINSIELSLKANTKVLDTMGKGIDNLSKNVLKLSDLMSNMIDEKSFKKSINNIDKDFDTFSKHAKNNFAQISHGFDDINNSKFNSSFLKDLERQQSNASQSQVGLSEAMKMGALGMSKFNYQTRSLISRFEALIPTMLGVHFGISGVVREAFQANQETLDWSKSLNTLSNSSGSTSLAIGQMHTVFGMSAGSLDTVRQVLISLSAQGIPNTTKGFESLTAWVTNLSLASGIGAESFSSFAGIMVRNWQVSIGSTQRMMSSVLALQDTFGMTAGEVEVSMKTIGDAMEKVGPYFSDGTKSAYALTKGISQTIGVLSKFGISTQKAAEWVGKLIDPEQMGENIGLLNKVGISYQDYMDMMASGDAKEMIFDRLLTNLPQVAEQIQNIANPMARMNFAKSLGLPLEIAQKMAKATTGEISQLMKDYKAKAQGDKAAQKKQEQMAAESQKFNDTLHLMKRDALQPMMAWINKNIWIFWDIAKKVFGLFKRYTEGLTKVFDAIKESFMPAMDVLNGGGNFPDFLAKLAGGFIDIAGKAIGFIGKTLIEQTPNILGGAVDFWLNMMKSNPIITTLASVALGLKAFSAGKSFFGDLFARGSSRARPMFVQNAGDLSAGGSSFLDMFTGRGKGAKTATDAVKTVTTSAPKKAGLFSRMLGMGSTFSGMAIDGLGTAGTVASAAPKAGMLAKAGGAIGGVATKGIGLATKGIGLVSKAFGPMGLAIGGLMGAFEGAMNAADTFATKSSSAGEKFAGGIAGALNGLTFGLMSDETQKAIARGIGGLLSNKKDVEKEIEGFTISISEGKKLTATELDRLGYLLQNSNSTIKDANLYQESIRIQSKEQDERELTEKEKFIKKLIQQNDLVKAADVAKNVSFADIEKRKIKERQEITSTIDESGSGANIISESFLDKGNTFRNKMWGVEDNTGGKSIQNGGKNKGGMQLDVEKLSDESRNKIMDETQQLMNMMGYGMTQEQAKIVESYKEKMRLHESGEITLTAQQQQFYKSRIKFGEELEKKKFDAEKFYKLEQLHNEAKLLEKKYGKDDSRTKAALDKFAAQNKAFGNLSDAQIAMMGYTGTALVEKIGSMVQGLEAINVSAWYQQDVDEYKTLKASLKQMATSQTSAYANDTGNRKFIADVDQAIIDLEKYKAKWGGDAKFDKQAYEKQKADLVTTKEMAAIAYRERKRAKENETKHLNYLKNMDRNTGAGAAHAKSIDEKTVDQRSKDQQRQDWLSSMIGMKGMIKIGE